MRYARFKKQMEGTSSVRRPRKPNAPKKTKVDKKTAASKAQERTSNAGLKLEPMDGEIASPVPTAQADKEKTPVPDSSSGMVTDPQTPPTTATIKCDPETVSSDSSNLPTPYPNTPESTMSHSTNSSPTFPSPISTWTRPCRPFDGRNMVAWDQNSGPDQTLFQPDMVNGGMIHQNGFNDMGMSLMQHEYENLWGFQNHGNEIGNGDIFIKSEPRWDDAYRRI